MNSIDSVRGSDVFAVEDIVERRIRRGRVEYRVRWQGFSKEQDSWEPHSNLKDSCSELIKNFLSRSPSKIEKRSLYCSSDDDVIIVDPDLTSSVVKRPSPNKSTESNEQPRNPTSTRSSKKSPVGGNPTVSEQIPFLSTDTLSVNTDTISFDSRTEINGSAKTSLRSNTSSNAKSASKLVDNCKKSNQRHVSPKFEQPSEQNTSSKSSSSATNIEASNSPTNLPRKSITITLKAQATHEFQSNQSKESSLTSKSRLIQPAVGIANHVSDNKSHEAAVTEFEPGSNETKVMNIVRYVRSRNNRPVRENIITLCHRQHSLDRKTVIDALSKLVAANMLCELKFDRGISYLINKNYPGPITYRTSSFMSKGLKRKHKSLSIPLQQRGVINGDSRRSEGGGVAKKMARSGPSSTTERNAIDPTTTNQSNHYPTKQFSEPVSTTSGRGKTRPLLHAPGMVNGGTATLKGTIDVVKENCSSSPSVAPTLLPPTPPRIIVLPSATPPTPSIESLRADLARLPCNARTPQSVDTRSTASTSGTTIANNQPTRQRTSQRQAAAAYYFKSFRSLYACHTSLLPSSSSPLLQVTNNQSTTASYFTQASIQSTRQCPMKNAFTIQILQELTTLLTRSVNDQSRLLMLTGTGSVFSSGIDLSVVTGRSPFCPCGGDNVSESSANSNPVKAETSSFPCFCSVTPPNSSVDQLIIALRAFLLALLAYPKPVVLGLNGPALGLGVAIIPLCDLVYASDSATFHLPYTRLGQVPEAGASYTLTSMIGLPLANELLLAGRKLSAREALQRGLVSDVLAPKSFHQQLVARCGNLMSSSTDQSLQFTKCLLRLQHRDRIEFTINAECDQLAEIWSTESFRRQATDFLTNRILDFV